jgi:UDP-glucose 4-epimerase
VGLENGDNMNVLITGGLGYIGSHTVAVMTEMGWTVDVIDDMFNNENYNFVQSRANNLWTSEIQEATKEICDTHYDAIIHLAALISVEQSVREPNTYWRNNLTALMDLYRLKTDHLVFASTGTAFNPTNPYAQTKVACENYIKDLHGSPQAWFKGHTIFRFYNVSGLRPGLKPTGQPTHLIRICAEAARGLRDEVRVFGHDYNTRDGTAVRDYIHVEDIANSILNAVTVGPSNSPFECLGTGTGHTVLEVIQSMKKVTGVDFRVTMSSRRAGDDAITICPSQYKHISLTKTLDDMCLSAYQNL